MKGKSGKWTGVDVIESFNTQVKQYFTPIGVDFETVNSELNYSIDVSKEVLLIFHAIWSIHSIIQTKNLLTELKSINANFKILILNLDILKRGEDEAFLGQVCHGNGEAVLLVNSIRKVLILGPGMDLKKLIEEIKLIDNKS